METKIHDKILLASASPQRRELLNQIGVQHDVLAVNIDEASRSGESPEVYVQRVAMEKAAAGYLRQMGSIKLPSLGADTIVLLADQILGKPKDKNESCATLKLLSGETHQVFTAVAMADADKSLCLLSRSKVTFRVLTDEEITAYWASGEPVDKAGGYAIQGLAAAFIRKLEGSYSGVMGLPLFETAELLRDFGVFILGDKEK